jgi:hypothetical protein
MKGRTRLYVLAGLVVVILVLVSQCQKPAATVTSKQIAVVAAKHDIPPYSILAAQDIYTVTLPIEQALNLFEEREMQDLIGQMATVELRTGNPIKHADALIVPAWFKEQMSDMLIFSFYVSTDRIVGGKLRPGHHIDLQVSRPGISTQEQEAESLWLARNLWVVGVQQSSGGDILRPTVSIYSTITPQSSKSGSSSSGGLLGGVGGSTSGTNNNRDVPANLVVVAAHRAIAKTVTDYLGARLYEASVAIRVGQTTDPLGRIDGIVSESLGSQDNENKPAPGIDNVKITLYSGSGALLKEVQTNSGGRFFFDKLAQGDYYVEEVDPQGYVSASSNRLAVFVADGENLHLVFSDQKIAAATTDSRVAAAKPGTGTSSAAGTTPVPPTPAATPTPAAPKTEATPTRAAGSGTLPIATPVAGACSVYMSSDEKGSVSLVNFPAHTKEVWAILMFNQFPKDDYSIRAFYASTGEERQVSSGAWPGGSGTKAVAIRPGAGTSGEFQAGAYITVLKTGPDTIRDVKWWFVDMPQSAQASNPNATSSAPLPTVQVPKGGSGVERQR